MGSDICDDNKKVVQEPKSGNISTLFFQVGTQHSHENKQFGKSNLSSKTVMFQKSRTFQFLRQNDISS